MYLLHRYLLFSCSSLTLRFPALALELGKTFGGVIGSHLSHLTSETRKPSGVTRLNQNVEQIRTPSSIRRKRRPYRDVYMPFFVSPGVFGVVGSWRYEESGDESRVVGAPGVLTKYLEPQMTQGFDWNLN